MANGYNQYIGMRYVPIVDGAWSATKAYEPLVVVTYNGNSYISKTFVPAGTLPTNEEYWILSANYNAQVEQYRQEVREYQSIVENFDTDISGLESGVETLQTTVGNQQTAIDGHTEDIATINETLFNMGSSRHSSGSQNIGSSVNTFVTVCSLALPKGKWVLFSHLEESSSGTGTMANRIVTNDYQPIVRATELNGGGCANICFVEVSGETETVTLEGLTSHSTTIRGRLDAVLV